MLPLALQRFIETYEGLDKTNLHQLSEVYSADIQFQDPMHSIQGLTALMDYFTQLYSNLHYCQFTIQHSQAQDTQAFVTWQMEYVHPRLNRGKAIMVAGASHLQFQEKIHYHRDYLDLGQMLYEHIPLLGTAIRTLKKRVAV